MKNLERGVTCAVLILMCTLGWAPAHAASENDDELREREQFRAQMMKTYQDLANLSDSDWNAMMLREAAELEIQGKSENARVLRKLSEPRLRDFTLDLFKNKVDEVSQNGLLWRYYHGLFFACYGGRGCLFVLLFIIVTLDGTEAPNF